MQLSNMSHTVRWYFNFTKWTPSHSEMLLATSCIQDDEKQRIAKFVFKKDFKSALIGRLMLRKFVSQYSNMSYNEINFVRDSRGKPILRNFTEYPNLSFNVSHQGDLVAFTGHLSDQTTPYLLLGVDVMKLEYTGGKSVPEFFRIMTRNFSNSEWEYIRSFTGDFSQISAFIRLWCLKESYVKATGVGITVKLEDISFNINTRELESNKIVTDTELYVQKQKLPDWFFQETQLENATHAVSVASNLKIPEVLFKEVTFEEILDDAIPLLDKDEKYVCDYFKKLDKT